MQKEVPMNNHSHSKWGSPLEGKVKVIMKDYIKEMLDELDGDMDGVATTPIGQYCRGMSVHPVMSQVVSQNGGTRLDDSVRFGETQGDSETPGEV
jgi:hypothetical protein